MIQKGFCSRTSLGSLGWSLIYLNKSWVRDISPLLKLPQVNVLKLLKYCYFQIEFFCFFFLILRFTLTPHLFKVNKSWVAVKNYPTLSKQRPGFLCKPTVQFLLFFQTITIGSHKHKRSVTQYGTSFCLGFPTGTPLLLYQTKKNWNWDL